MWDTLKYQKAKIGSSLTIKSFWATCLSVWVYMQWDLAILDRGEVNVDSFKFKKMEAFKHPVKACIPNQDPPWTSKYSPSQKYLSILQSTSQLSLAKLDPSYRPSSKTVSISGNSAKSPQLKGKVHVLPLPPVDDTVPNSLEPGSTKPKGCFLHPLRGKLLSKLKCGIKGTCPEKIDFACRFLFPLSYIIYNTAYWYVYLHGIEILAWDSHTIIRNKLRFTSRNTWHALRDDPW